MVSETNCVYCIVKKKLFCCANLQVTTHTEISTLLSPKNDNFISVNFSADFLCIPEAGLCVKCTFIVCPILLSFKGEYTIIQGIPFIISVNTTALKLYKVHLSLEIMIKIPVR